MTRIIRGLVASLVAAGLAFVWSPGPAQAAPPTTAYSVQSEGNDNLYRIDLTTGATTAIGATGFTSIEALAFSASGTLYGVDDIADQLVRIDTATGAATAVGPLGVDVNDVGLAFDCAGTLWMATFIPGGFYRLDPATGAASLVGAQGQAVTGLTAVGNTVYGIGARPSNNLVTIDTATGVATPVGPLGVNVLGGGIDVDDAGVVWGLEQGGQVFTVDRATGAATLGATTSAGFESLAVSGPAGCLSVADVTAPEGGTATFTVTLSTAMDTAVTVQFATADATATAPGDYTATSGTLSFAAGERTRTVTVPVVADCAADPGEAFTLALSTPTGGAAVSDAAATATVTDTACEPPPPNPPTDPPPNPCQWERPGHGTRPAGDARPGYGRGDHNHCHAGPPGRR